MFFIINQIGLLCAAVHVAFLDPTAHGKQSRMYELSTYMLTSMAWCWVVQEDFSDGGAIVTTGV